MATQDSYSSMVQRTRHNTTNVEIQVRFLVGERRWQYFTNLPVRLLRHRMAAVVTPCVNTRSHPRLSSSVVERFLDMEEAEGSIPSRGTGHWSPHPHDGRPGRGQPYTHWPVPSGAQWVLTPSPADLALGLRRRDGVFNSLRGHVVRGWPSARSSR